MSEVSRWIWPFELLEKIGAGGMGVVYRARFVKNDKIVAVKLLPPDVTDEIVLARFQRELDVLKDLRHPHIVHCFGGLCEDKQQFYAMECIEGGTLDALIRERGKLPWKLVVEYGLQMCSALACAHDRGVIHRDVKPGNFLITDEGQLKLSDFGLVSVLAARTLTATDRTLGTIRYMAPEQISGEAVGRQTDLYALGCSLFEMLVGYAPFRGETPAATLRMHLAEDPARVSEIVGDCPDDLDALVAELLSKEPADRPESAEAVARRLREMTPRVSVKPHRREGGASNQPTVARSAPLPLAKPREPARGGRSWHSAALQGAIVVVALLSIWVVSLRRSRTSQAVAEQLWKEVLRSDSDTAVRIRAAEAMAQIGLEGGDTLPMLVDGLKDADPQVRAAAIQAVGELGGDAEDVLPELRRIQQRDESPLVRQSVAPAIKRIRNGSGRSNVGHSLLLAGIVAGAAAGVICVRRLQPVRGTADSERSSTSVYAPKRRVRTETLTNVKKAGQS